MAPNPLLRLLVRAEHAASGPVNRAANSRQAGDVLLQLGRVAQLAGAVTERARAVAVHALALPSHRDLQILEAKVERLQRTLDEWVASSQDEKLR